MPDNEDINMKSGAYSFKKDGTTMELFIYLIPNNKRKQDKALKKLENWQEPKEVQIGDNMVWIWKMPYTKEEMVMIQENFWKQKFFFYWLNRFFKGGGNRQILKQMKKAVTEKQFQDYYATDAGLRKIYALYYLMHEFEWKKETKWFILCGNLMDGGELLEFISYFLQEANCVFVYECSLSEVELDGLWEESGLLLTKTRSLEALKECDLVLDAREGMTVPKRYLPEKMTYVDLSEEGAKKRFLQAKCGKIKYISLRNYLDRAFLSTV